MTEHQVENWSIGIRAAVSLAIFMVLQAITATAFVYSLKGEMGVLNANVTEIRTNQDESRERADVRQAAIEGGLDAVEARVRPLETQAATTAATLSSINQSLLSLNAEFRDLRRDITEANKPAAPATTRR